MRTKLSTLRQVALAAASTGLLSSCIAAEHSSATVPAVMGVEDIAQRAGAAPGTRWAPGSVAKTPAQPGGLFRSSVPLASPTPFTGVYVSDLGVKYGGGGVWLFAPRTYKNLGSLSNGMYGPDGEWVDQYRNFYVANFAGGNVTEYAPGATSPTCTYSGAADPTNVRTDKIGKVFVVDWNIGHSGSIDVYKQCQDSIVKRYTFGKDAPASLAFDSHSNMFVLYLHWSNSSKNNVGALEEFKRYSKTPIKLGATLTFPGGLLIDDHQNLIAADQGVAGQPNGAIDLIAPPYSKAVPLISNLNQPVFLSMNPHEGLLFASSFDHSTPTVWVFYYPSGKLKTTIGSTSGLVFPLGVATSPDDAL